MLIFVGVFEFSWIFFVYERVMAVCGWSILLARNTIRPRTMAELKSNKKRWTVFVRTRKNNSVCFTSVLYSNSNDYSLPSSSLAFIVFCVRQKVNFNSPCPNSRSLSATRFEKLTKHSLFSYFPKTWCSWHFFSLFLWFGSIRM